MRALYLHTSMIAVALLTAGTAPAHAETWQPWPKSDLAKQCEAKIDYQGVVNSQRLVCATRDMDRADASLNATYRQVMSRLTAERRHQLVVEERAWIKRRHNVCAAATEPNVPHDLERMWCLVAKTDRRTAKLRSML